ncbi:synthetase [Nakamurella antarctica]|uniref:Synthetase n=1 Tax=Nakamurella antarctica TaxID=1902245 RepID=A0A3G8ZU37_9ACTN|nr:AMP-binding protein [Nakamurella antarctica]AZI57301.1 synthetase [Nakamurella antarctica]
MAGNVRWGAWLGGADDTAALNLAGRQLTYGQLRGHIAGVPKPEASTITASPDPLETLIAFYAALAAGLPVLVAEPGSPARVPDSLPAGTFLLAQTSGSAGRARTIARTAASWSDSFAPFTEITSLTASDQVCLTGPLHATMHLFAAVHALSIGAQVTDNLTQASAVHCVPTKLSEILIDPPDSLRRAIVAGAGLPDALAAKAVSRGIAVVEYYGAAELSFVAASRVPAPMTAFPGVEIELRQGQLWSRSPYLSLGYAGETAGETTGALARDANGFASVGDMATHAPGGGLRIVGRADAAITTGGTTVIAEDVEAALEKLVGITAAAVTGVEHPRFGHVVAAVLELSVDADFAGIRTAARQVLGPAALPRLWFQCDQLPRTGSGKLARGEIRAAISGAAPTARRLA